jgi:ribonuclease HII
LVLVTGVDDAGRGCVIGPLVIAGILIEERDIPHLKSLGVKDSKLLTSKRRCALAPKIEGLVLKSSYKEIPPIEIDKVVFKAQRLHKLNLLEAMAMADVINQLTPNVAYVDASDVLADRYGRQIVERLSAETKVISEHKADVNYPVVSAASILAKVRRDSIIEDLKRVYGDFGTGYPHDPRLRSFLLKWYEENGTFPEPVRKSWKTIRNIISIKSQEKLI